MVNFDEDDVVAKSRIRSIAWQTRWGIRLSGLLLISLFAWLQIKPAELAQWLESTPPDFLLKLELGVLYTCWYFGASWDLSFQETVLERDPDQGRIPYMAYGAFGVFILVAVVLVWASGSEELFALALCLFWIASNGLGWYMRTYVISPKINETMRYVYAIGDFYKFEKLTVVTKYLYGNWMVARAIVGFVLTLVLVAVSLSIPSKLLAASVIGVIFGLKVSVAILLVPSLTFCLFLVVTEGWQWTARLSTFNSLRMLDTMREKYRLDPRFVVRR